MKLYLLSFEDALQGVGTTVEFVGELALRFCESALLTGARAAAALVGTLDFHHTGLF